MEKTRAGVIAENFLRTPLYILSRPFKGFYDMKYLRRGRTHFAVAMLALLCLSAIMEETYTGFAVSWEYEPDHIISVPYVMLMTLLPVLLFIAGNWSVTSISEGKGTARDILHVYAYALYPKLILTFIGILVSNFVTKEEGAFAVFFFVFGTVVFYFYLFIGLVVIHEYSFFRSLLMVLQTIFAMLVIIFVLALFASLVNELRMFVVTIIYELRMRS
ncbi:MAG: hypothetical protein LBR83_01245 [Clostridiales bacterium]|jgi:hypothetical protein|nr:hypothetical protein [Clostridiales bacterium]